MKIYVLDHGYVDLVRVWGSEQEIIEAARMSTGKGFLGWEPEVRYTCTECEYVFVSIRPVDEAINCLANPSHGRMVYKLVHHGDAALLRRLYTDKHMTPFEMAGMVIEVQAPIFVFREWHRHRTQSYNEMSARYTPLPDVNYIPTVERLMINSSGSNKQANRIAGAPQLTEEDAIGFQGHLRHVYTEAQMSYERGLEMGVPKELARALLPVGRYSRMRASTNLRCWLMFLKLRMDKDAQWEIRQYADVVGHMIAEYFPQTWRLFTAENG